MDVATLLKIAGIGLLVSVVCQILDKSGKTEQSTLVSVGGIVVVLVLLVGEIGQLLSAIRAIFGI